MTNVSTARALPRAEHIGSLLRPPSLRSVIDEIGAHQPGHSDRHRRHSDAAAAQLRAAEDAAIAAALDRQIAAGLDVVTDGEMRRTLFTNSFYDALSGLRPSDASNSIAWRNTRGEEIRYPGPPVIASRLEKVANPAADSVHALRELTDQPIKVTFPAASWFVAPLARTDAAVPGYESREEMQAHAVEILRELALEAIDAGADYVQFDLPAYVFLIDEGVGRRLADAGVDRSQLLERCVEADTKVLEGLPQDVRYGLHLCRGNYRSSWAFEGSIEPVAQAMFALPYDSFLIEWDDPERSGGLSSLRHLPDDSESIVVLGLVSTKTPEMETEDDLLRRIDEAATFAPVERLALSPQCGFASSMEGNLIDEDVQWRKLELVGRVAEKVWPRS